MSVIYYCDAPGCVKKVPGEIGPEGWDSPVSWGGGRDDTRIYDTCSPECAGKVGAEIAAREAKEAEEKKAEEQTITPDDVGTLEV